MSVKVRTKDDKKAGWQRSLASRTPKKHNLGAVAWLNFSANATAPSFFPLWQFQVFWPDNFCQHFPDIIIIKLSKTEHSAHAMGKGLLL